MLIIWMDVLFIILVDSSNDVYVALWSGVSMVVIENEFSRGSSRSLGSVLSPRLLC